MPRRLPEIPRSALRRLRCGPVHTADLPEPPEGKGGRCTEPGPPPSASPADDAISLHLRRGPLPRSDSSPTTAEGCEGQHPHPIGQCLGTVTIGLCLVSVVTPKMVRPTTLAIDVGGTGLKASVLDAGRQAHEPTASESRPPIRAHPSNSSTCLRRWSRRFRVLTACRSAFLGS